MLEHELRRIGRKACYPNTEKLLASTVLLAVLVRLIGRYQVAHVLQREHRIMLGSWCPAIFATASVCFL